MVEAWNPFSGGNYTPDGVAVSHVGNRTPGISGHKGGCRCAECKKGVAQYSKSYRIRRDNPIGLQRYEFTRKQIELSSNGDSEYVGASLLNYIVAITLGECDVDVRLEYTGRDYA